MWAGSGSDSSFVDWKKYLNPSSEEEGNAESESSTGHNLGHQAQETGANAPGIAGEAGQGPVDMGPTAEVPTAEYLTKRIPAVLHTNRRAQTRILNDVFDTLQLERASPEKLLIISKVLNAIEEDKDNLRNNKNERLDIFLTVKVTEMLNNKS